MQCKVLVFQPIDHVSVSATDGIGPTQGHRKTLIRRQLVMIIYHRTLARNFANLTSKDYIKN